MFGHKCAACEAKNQTITLLADLVDWHRAQMTAGVSIGANAGAPHIPAAPVFAAPGALWARDEEEDVYAALEDGSMDTEAAEKALAYIQAQNTTLEVVR